LGQRRRTVVGVDGCRGGWVAVIDAGDRPLAARVFPTFQALIDFLPRSALLGVDIPIGLADTGSRGCDVAARKRLGRPRGSSVFPAPLRATLRARTYADACRIRMRIDGKKMSRQAYGILNKIGEVDGHLQRDRGLARRVIEVHPELSFAEWNRGIPLQYAKRKSRGKAERHALIERVWPSQALRLYASLRGTGCALDDLHDAFAALWSMRRWAASPDPGHREPQDRDSTGLIMRIVS
jgi:predicted RNase H-like nuclease